MEGAMRKGKRKAWKTTLESLPKLSTRASDEGGGMEQVMIGLRDECGQGTVEAAIVIPVLFVLLLLLLQPGIVLYDRLIMGNAAAEGCRLLATANETSEAYEAFIRHKLSAVPQHDCFHVHHGSCSWKIEMSGNETSSAVTVRISNELRPLPLFDMGSKLLGMTNGNGNLVIEESVTMPTQPDWAAASPSGTNPTDWIGAWTS